MGAIIAPIIQCIVSTLDMIYHKNNPTPQINESDKMIKKIKKIEFIEMKNDEGLELLSEKIDRIEEKMGNIPTFSPIKSPRNKFK